MKARGLISFIMIVCMASLSYAGPRISVRLVEASNLGEGIDSRIRDVVHVLKKSLVFKKYSLVASASLQSPARGQTMRLGPYSVTCKGDARSMSIRVKQGRAPLLYTTASLSKGKPLALGGFPSRNGRMILVFLAQ